MPVPVINPVTSIQGYRQYQSFELGLFASNLTGSADTWTSSTLPPGLALNAGTGVVSGAITVPGVWTVGFQVSNSNGLSAVLAVPFAAEPAGGSLHTGVDLGIDLQTGVVSTGATVADGEPLFAVKENDDQLLYVSFQRSGTVIDLGTLGNLEYALKQREPESVITLGGGDGSGSPPKMLKSGSGADTVYLVAVKYDGDLLAGALADSEADDGTSFIALAELTWQEANASGCGPATLTRTSQTFPVRVVRDLRQ